MHARTHAHMHTPPCHPCLFFFLCLSLSHIHSFIWGGGRWWGGVGLLLGYFLSFPDPGGPVPPNTAISRADCMCPTWPKNQFLNTFYQMMPKSFGSGQSRHNLAADLISPVAQRHFQPRPLLIQSGDSQIMSWVVGRAFTELSLRPRRPSALCDMRTSARGGELVRFGDVCVCWTILLLFQAIFCQKKKYLELKIDWSRKFNLPLSERAKPLHNKLFVPAEFFFSVSGKLVELKKELNPLRESYDESEQAKSNHNRMVKEFGQGTRSNLNAGWK